MQRTATFAVVDYKEFASPKIAAYGCQTCHSNSWFGDDSDLTRELFEQNFDDKVFRCTDYGPILQKIVFWEVHQHSHAAGHGKPHPDPSLMPPLGTSRQRTESAQKEFCFMSGTTATLSSTVHRKGFFCISVQQCSMILDLF